MKGTHGSDICTAITTVSLTTTTHNSHTTTIYQQQGTGSEARAHAQRPLGWVSTAQRALRCLEPTTVEEEEVCDVCIGYICSMYTNVYKPHHALVFMCHARACLYNVV